MIPDQVVEEVRARADIVEVVGEFVPDLKKSGKDYKAKCPFHEDRTPSFYVVPAKGFYKCFGCGESGDAFTFVMKKMGLEFVEAVKYVGSRCGVDVQEVRRQDPEQDPMRPLLEANAFARDWFTAQLWESPAGARARTYLERRGVNREVADRFGLGYAPDDWRGLREAAAVHGIGDDVLLQVGLLTTSERSPEPYDRFRDRIIFPIETLPDRVVAFGGRVLDGGVKGAPKYLNSPETPLYHKGEVLYGLSSARHAIRREGGVLVVEGYMDVVSAVSAGLDHVVATLGTAMTPEHARLLKRYTTQVFLLFDSDLAGQKATFRAGDVLLSEGLHPSVVTLPPGEDPDSVAQSEGSDGLARYIDQALDIVDRKLQILEERDFFSSIDGVRRALDGLLPTVRAAADPALRDIYASKVAERTGVRPETIQDELRKAEAAPGRSGDPSARRPDPRQREGRGTTPRIGIPALGPERQLLLLLVKDRSWIDRAGELIGSVDFVEPTYRVIFEALVEDPELQAAPDGMDLAARAALEALLGSEEELAHGGRVFEDSVARIRRQSLDRRIFRLRRDLLEGHEGPEADEAREELEHLEDERKALGEDPATASRNLLKLSRGGNETSDG
jgi:DNA primase